MQDRLRNRWVLFAGVGALAAAIALVLILVSVVGGSSDKKASPATTARADSTSAAATPEAPAGVPGGAETAALFRGIPQRLNELGKPNAPATLIEFADLQCPFCREYAVSALPAIVKEYVRPGKVKLVFGGIAFIGPASETALRAAYAAGLQNRLWNYIDLLYRNQGAENSGWVTEDLLRTVGESIPGLDVDRMMTARQGQAVQGALAEMQRQADSAHVNSTPSFFAGPTGGTLQSLHVTALTADAFRPALDQLAR